MTNNDNKVSIRLLVIDDDSTLTEMMQFTLSRKGVEVYVANSGPAGVETARHTNPNVILLDLMMPELDGWQVCKKIREFSNVPIIVMSAVVDSQLVVRALDVGANDYLVKPVPEGVLLARLERWAQQSETN